MNSDPLDQARAHHYRDCLYDCYERLLDDMMMAVAYARSLTGTEAGNRHKMQHHLEALEEMVAITTMLKTALEPQDDKQQGDDA